MSNEKAKKAYIKILKGSKKGEEIPLQFNPAEYSTQRVNTFKEKKLKNLKNMKKQFQDGKESDISLNLLFDSTDDGIDVRDKIERFAWLVDIDPELHAPPPCIFIWANFKVIAVVTKLTKKFTYFYQDGVPARVRISLTLKPYKTTKEIEAETKKHSADLTKVRTTYEGDNIWLMAYREYEDPKLWRIIANANNIDNPIVIDYGRKLIIPPRKENE